MQTPKPLLRVGVGSGQPNMPASEPPFVPLNPWGRDLPRPVRAPRPVLYQIVVRDKRWGNRETPIFPRMEKEFAEMLRLKIVEQIGLGAETRWSSPVLVPVVG